MSYYPSRRRRTYRSRRTKYYAPMYKNPRARYGKVASRGPFAILPSNRAEKKYIDNWSPPQPISFGVVNGTSAWNFTSSDVWRAFTGTNTGGLTYLVNNCIQGVADNQRVGSKIYCKSLLLNVAWRLPESWTDTTPLNPIEYTPTQVMIRTMVVLDRQPVVGTLVAIDDILQSIVHLGNNYPQPLSPNNLYNRQRFKTLLDIRDTLNPAGDQFRTYDRFLPLNFSSIFALASPTTPTQGLTTNALYVIFLSDGYQYQDPNDPTQKIDTRPLVKIVTRVRFTDP